MTATGWQTATNEGSFHFTSGANVSEVQCHVVIGAGSRATYEGAAEPRRVRFAGCIFGTIDINDDTATSHHFATSISLHWLQFEWEDYIPAKGSSIFITDFRWKLPVAVTLHWQIIYT